MSDSASRHHGPRTEDTHAEEGQHKARHHIPPAREGPARRKDCRGRRREATRREQVTTVTTALRLGLVAWEIAWTLVRDHIALDAGPGRPL